MSDDLQRAGELSQEKRTLLALRRMQVRIDTLERARTEPIAIVGMSCRFPGGANDPDSFWRLLSNRVDAITEVPAERWDVDEFYDPNPETPDKMSTRWGGFLDQVDRFDAAFFGISPREAMRMDPQQRLFLEVAWEALERAGQPIDQLTGSKTGVFVGVSNNDYFQLQLESTPINDAYLESGGRNCFLPGRLCYLLDFRGPSVAVDTVCSSSLVAVHLACQSLRVGDCHMALAGGINLILSPLVTTMISKWGVAASDGRCKTFDARANGTVRSEGCGVVVLKRLSDALADGDPILALIRGSAVNQDGRSTGLTAPNGQAQQALIRLALANAGVDPAAISYVETHGTGTTLGDSIEVESLAAVLGQVNDRPCALGAVKTNIGHTEAAAGVAGLIKTVLAMRHETIPPNLHFQKLNPHIPLHETRFVLPTEPRPWPSGGERRYASVSSFGLSGTNAHLIVEEPPQIEQPAVAARPDRAYVLPLSARSAAGLVEVARAYEARLREPSVPPLADLVHTASLRRSHHTHRLAVVGTNTEVLAEQLAAFARGETPAGLVAGEVPVGVQHKMVFVFPGQGSQWVGMGRQLLAQEPVFRTTIEQCAAAFQPYVDWALLDVLQSDTPLERIDVIQPTLFAIEVSLSALWQSWGVEPAAVVGHSMGEIAAAYVAGVLTLEDAAKVICCRSKLLRRLSGQGAMALVEMTLAEAEAALVGYEDRLSVAVSNSPRSTVLSGDVAALDEVLGVLEQRQVFYRRVKADVAGHSPYLDPLLPELQTLLEGVQPASASVAIYSTVESRMLDGREMDTAYWVRNLRAPVRFSTTLAQLIADEHTLFLELSPHPILLPAVEGCLREYGRAGTALPSLRNGQPEHPTLLETLGMLYTCGYPVAWRAIYGASGRYVALPTYPWQRDRYWFDTVPRRARARGVRTHPLLGARVSPAAQPGTHFWEVELSLGVLPYLAEHQVQGLIVLPGTAYLELALTGARALFGEDVGELAQVAFVQMLSFGSDEVRAVQLAVVEETSERARFEILSRPAGATEASWTLHARGLIRRAAEDAVPAAHTLGSIQARCAERLTGPRYYERLGEQGLEYGASFQGIAELWRQDGEALARLERSATVRAETSSYTVHPALLDAALQAFNATLPADDTATYLPVEIARVRYLGRPGEGLWSHARLIGAADGPASGWQGDLTLLDTNGAVLVEVQGMRLQRLAGEQRQVLHEWGYELGWEVQPRPEIAEARAEAERAQWLLFSDAAGVGRELAMALRGRGAQCVEVWYGAGGWCAEGQGYRADARDPGVLRQLLETAYRSGCRNVVFLWGLEQPGSAAPTLAEMADGRERGVESLTVLVQALVQMGWRDTPRLWVVTRATQAVPGIDRAVQPVQAPLWGLGRTLMYEHPKLHCTLIDLAASGGDAELGELEAELWAQTSEDQIALRPDGRYVARLVRLPGEAAADDAPATLEPAQGRAFHLETARPGVLEHLTLREMRRRAPGPGEVEIKVEAAGLNFLDVLTALGIYPGQEPGTAVLGNECAGTITAVGAGVSGLAVGDAVVACAPGSFGTFVTTPACAVVHKPAQFDFVNTAGLPIVFLTAYYGLRHLARLEAGERVLIHSAASGTGLAAVQIAQQIGAEIFATAGTPEKREFLRALGVPHVHDSRSLRFADEIMELTGGAGVDVVLNSLTGDAIPASMGVLGRYGRFVELGKKDIYQGTRLDLTPFRNSLAYYTVDMAGMIKARPARFQAVLREVMQLFADGTLQPQPLQVFPIAQATDAFHTMAQGKHIGKIVLSLAEQEQVPIAPPAAPATLVRADGTYLISGGLGGLGLAVARWLVEQGARHLALFGRRAPSDDARVLLAELAAAGADVRVFQADVARPDDVARALDTIAHSLPPLCGVMHLAMVLDDGVITQLAPTRFAPVMAPKIDGAWNLHTLTLDQPLDFFVLFSSVASLLGSPGQGNYAAANAFLDALAHYRRTQGRPGLSINWGPWAEVGGAAAQANRGERLAYRGMASMRLAQGLEALAALMRLGHPQAGVLPLNLRQWRQFYPKVAASPLFSHLAQEQERGGTLRLGKSAVREMLLAADSDERQGILEEHLRDQICQVLRLTSSQISVQRPLGSMGFDSLLALEFRNRLESSLGLTLPGTLIWRYPTINALIPYLAESIGIELGAPKDERLNLGREQEPVAQEDEEALRLLTELGLLDALEQLSDAEVRQLLSS